MWRIWMRQSGCAVAMAIMGALVLLALAAAVIQMIWQR